MKEPKIVTHPGEIFELTPQKVVVKILSKSACASCHAKGACTMADMAEKFVDVYYEHPEELTVGQKVIVEMRKSMGPKAVLLAYLLPMVVLVGGLVGFLNIFSSQGLAGALALGLLIPYYVILYLLKDRLKKEFNFTIRLDEI